MRMRGLLASVPVVFLLAACGGGSGGVSSTPAPTPTPSPTPSPTPTPTAGASGSYPALAVTGRFTVSQTGGDLILSAVGQHGTTLTVAYDAPSKSYTLTSGSETASFGQSDLSGAPNANSVSWTKGSGLSTQYLTMGHQTYVSGGFWQRHKQNGGLVDVDLDAFVFGSQTPKTEVPANGTARFDVWLSGTSGKSGEAVYPIAGTGKVEIDFASGAFRTSGETRSFNLDVDYWVGGSWSGNGLLSASSNALEGYITLAARYHTVTGSLSGAFFGPGASEVGAVIQSVGKSDAAFVGALTGARSGTVDSKPFTVLPNGADRTYFGPSKIFGLTTYNGGQTWDSSGLLPFNAYLKLNFGADGHVEVIGNPGSSTDTSVTFTDANKVQAQSSAAYTVYALDRNGDHYRFVLANPGSGNNEIQLTYSSFGHLDLERSNGTVSGINQLWFAYGAESGTIAGKTGTGQYAGILKGSGGDYRDGSRYTVDGTAALSVNFDTLSVTGEFRPVATLASGSTPITLPVWRFSATSNGIGFGESSFIVPDAGSEGLDVAGRFYGPTAGELAGTFQYAQRNGGGFPVNWFSGAFATKLTP